MNTSACPVALRHHMAYQPFEADFFGGAVWRLTNPADPAIMREIIAYLEKSGARFAYCRISEADEAAERNLLATGFTPIEELVTLERELTEHAARPLAGDVTLAGKEVAPEIDILARRAFRHDRYHVDRRISAEIADALKGSWAHNNAAGRANATFVSRSSGKIRGFNTCLLQGEAAVIDLIAVDLEFQGLGIGRALVDAAIAHYATRATRMRVGTQKSNRASMQLYKKLGFREILTNRTFHWLPRRPA